MAAYRVPDVIISVPGFYVLFSDYPIALKKEAKEKVRERLFGYTMIRPDTCPIYLWRLTPKEDSTQSDLIGQARLPDIRCTPLTNVSQLRDLVTTLLYFTTMGHLPAHWNSRNLRREQARVWEALPPCGPVWWPDDLVFKSPSGKVTSFLRQELCEAVVRCYHLFNQGHLLPAELMAFASQVILEDPGELHMTQQMMKSYHDNYLKDGAYGVD